MTRLPRSATRAARTASAAALGAAAGTALAAAVAVSAPTAAQADTYRYWTYWKAAPGQSSWGFSPAGASSRPADGAVEGWRFALSGVAGSGGTQPRTAPSFDSICGGAPPVAGGVRVAVVVDFGTPDAQPPGETPPRGVVAYCATLDGGANGLDALAAGPWGPAVRTSGGLVCGIDGYPRTECGARVAAPAPTAAPAPSPTQPAAAAPKPPAASSVRPTSTASAEPASTGTTASATPGDPAASGAANLVDTDEAAPESVTATRPADAADSRASASASTSTGAPGGPPVAALAGFGLVVGVGGAAWWRMRGER